MGPLSSWLNQLEWIYDKDRNVACDCLRLEKIVEDLANYFSEIIKVPRENVSQNSQDYRDMYNNETREIVAELFRDDIEYFVLPLMVPQPAIFTENNPCLTHQGNLNSQTVTEPGGANGHFPHLMHYKRANPFHATPYNSTISGSQCNLLLYILASKLHRPG